ncbi:MAG TPA: response regulator [Planctomycetota bacterium]|nr:response regulator [Planctomycetota bacterium]
MELRGSILIAQPDRGERERLTRVLGGEGYLPFETASRREAVSLARDVGVDLALVDAYFPDGPGLDACEWLRGLGRGVRVIVVTSDPSRELRREALSVGAYAVVPKPVRPRIVLATVEAALSGRSQSSSWWS